MAQKFSEQSKRGLSTYAQSTIASLQKFRPETYRLFFNEQRIEQKAFAITFANASQYGNNAYVAPLAKTDDGFIDLCIMRPFPTYQLPGIAWRLFNRTLPQSAYLDIHKTTEVKLQSDQNLLIHFDGEPLQLSTNQLIVSIKHRCLKVLVWDIYKNALTPNS